MKRILAIILCVALCASLCAGAAAAGTLDDGDRQLTDTAATGEHAIQLGAGGIGAEDKVYFGEYASDRLPWYVIGCDKTAGAEPGPDSESLFLFSEYLLGFSVFDTGERVFAHRYVYSGSVLQARMDELYTTIFSGAEQSAVVPTDLVVCDWEPDAPTVEGARLFPLSYDEARAVGEGSGKLQIEGGASGAPDYWLRTVDAQLNPSDYPVVFDEGGYWHVLAGRQAQPSKTYGLRPACNLSLGSVLFISAAGGKASVAEGENPLAPNTALPEVGEWKLTLLDESRDFSAATVEADGDMITVAYSGASVGENEYVSAIVKGAEGSVKYYGRLTRPAEADGIIYLSDLEMAEGDTLWLFSERYNGGRADNSGVSDQASGMVEVPIAEANAYRISGSALGISDNSVLYRLIGDEGDYIAALSPGRHFALPETVELRIGGELLSEGADTYSYDSESGRLVIAAEAITGEVDIRADKAWLPRTLDNFTLSGTYEGYADVDESAWYGAEREGTVRSAALLGLMAGYGNGSFGPEDELRLGECVKLAAVIHDIYMGGNGVFIQGEPWYQVYVDYAVENGIIGAGDLYDYTAVCTRAQAAYILAYALPYSKLDFGDSPLEPISGLTPPDVAKSDRCGPEIYLLYAAGVLRGNDASGTFGGDGAFTRAQAAAIAARLCLPDRRMAG